MVLNSAVITFHREKQSPKIVTNTISQRKAGFLGKLLSVVELQPQKKTKCNLRFKSK